jgi:prepilin-type N-terminal cleavage/methylation domain-containing protein
MKNRRGFTLLEIVVTGSILALMMTMGNLTYKATNANIRLEQTKENEKTVALAIVQYAKIHGSLPSNNLSELHNLPLNTASYPTSYGWFFDSANGVLYALDKNNASTLPLSLSVQYPFLFDDAIQNGEPGASETEPFAICQ